MSREADGPGLRLPGPSENDSPGAATVTCMVDERWLRRTGHKLAADERARTMRTARIKLDRLLYREPPADHDCWECPGEFGDGGWQPHCRGGAA